MKKIFPIALTAFLMLTIFSCAKENSAYPEFFKLDNGLSVFVKEDHKVPLAYIEIAVRCGGVTQRRDNCGIFHLYEHMMFKGNSLYPNSVAFKKAMTDMGVDDYNGTTSQHCVNYFFTVPSSEIKKSLEFWNAAIRFPNLYEKDFNEEKKVVISEISAEYNSPGSIYINFLRKNFFPDAPWQLDPAGAVDTVQNASLDELKSIKEKYYVPDNAALFIGGDVTVEEIKILVSQIFGDWKKSGFDFSSETVSQTKTPFDRTRFFVLKNEKISPQIAQADIYYRGPDCDFDREDTYPLDVLSEYLGDPESSFCQKLMDDQELRIISEDYISGGYMTARRTGLISFSCTMLDPELSIPSRVKKFYSDISEIIIPEYIMTRKIISREKFKKMRQADIDAAVIDSELSNKVLEEARWAFTVADSEYYFDYEKNMGNVRNAQIAAVLDKYITGKNAFVVVSVNPSVYDNFKSEFDSLGFEEITRDKAYWFDNGVKE